MSYRTFNYDVKNHVAYLSIHFIPYSSLNQIAYDYLQQALNEAEEDQEVKVVVIFFINENIFELKRNPKVEEGEASRSLDRKQDYDTCGALIRKLSKPVIGVIQGFAIGSALELALACDIRICSERAKFAFPEINMATIPHSGGTQLLQKLVGPAIAKELLFFGLMIDSQKASEIHLVNLVIPDEEFLAQTECLAEKLAKQPTKLLGRTKETVNRNHAFEQFAEI